MKTEKLNFKNIKNVLSRAELKNIMAGSGFGGGGTGNCIPLGGKCGWVSPSAPCCSGSGCALPDGTNGYWYCI